MYSDTKIFVLFGVLKSFFSKFEGCIDFLISSGEDHGLGLGAVDLELPIGAGFLHYVYGFLKSLFSC